MRRRVLGTGLRRPGHPDVTPVSSDDGATTSAMPQIRRSTTARSSKSRGLRTQQMSTGRSIPAIPTTTRTGSSQFSPHRCLRAERTGVSPVSTWIRRALRRSSRRRHARPLRRFLAGVRQREQRRRQVLTPSYSEPSAGRRPSSRRSCARRTCHGRCRSRRPSSPRSGGRGPCFPRDGGNH